MGMWLDFIPEFGSLSIQSFIDLLICIALAKDAYVYFVLCINSSIKLSEYAQNSLNKSIKSLMTYKLFSIPSNSLCSMLSFNTICPICVEVLSV